MKIAIHHRKGSFSDRWIEYCKQNNIPYKIVNCYANNIVEQIKECDALMWHHNSLADYKDFLTAKKILFALEHAGVNVFPNFKSGWHFDDKVGQKYLLEAINAPLVPSYVFYDKQKALDWADSTTFPKVFKLTGGAGSKNVLLVRTRKQCRKLIKKSFGKGFTQSHRSNLIKDDLLRFKKTKNPINLLKAPARFFIKSKYARMRERDKGYIYFQEFIPDNSFDIRVVVVGNKAAAEKRFVRKNDFRASGGGEFSYEGIDKKVISIAFEVASKLDMRSVAFDFVLDNNQPLIVEICYGFGTKGIRNAPGFWDNNLKWHEDSFNPEQFMMESMLNEINNK